MRHSVMDHSCVLPKPPIGVYINIELVRVCGEEIGTYKGHISYDIFCNNATH